jgi:hypothetical protein
MLNMVVHIVTTELYEAKHIFSGYIAVSKNASVPVSLAAYRDFSSGKHI